MENLKLSVWITSRDVISNAGTCGRVSLGCLDLCHVTTYRFIFPNLHTVHSLLKLGIVVIFIHNSDVYMKCGAIKRWIPMIHRYDIKCVTRQQKEKKSNI